ncbi:hypothetical protein G6F23_011220 [Rhizopus arrhizus]|nr:hypothetical protein G6F23_011220 [Rhizopus arrhizus]
MGIDYESKVLEVDNHIVKAQIWDTSGQERFRSLFPSYCRDAKGVFIVYDITSRSSFENAQRWLRETRKYTDPNAVIMLVGNKADLSESSREVETEEGRSLAEEEGLLFIETSAKDATNINTAFTTLIGKFCSNIYEKLKAIPTNLPEKPQATPSQSITKKRMQSRFPRVRALFSRLFHTSFKSFLILFGECLWPIADSILLLDSEHLRDQGRSIVPCPA